MGNKGSESFRKVNEELLIEANTKYGADMGYIMLNEEVPPFPVIELAKPTTTLAQISAAADENLKAELMAQRELEERANEVVFNQRNDYRVKQEEMRKKDMGKLCGIIRGRLSDPVLVKLQEDPKFNEYQLGDPVRLLQKIKSICMTYKGDRYICSVVLNSIKQLANTAQGFKESTKNHMEQVKARLETLRNNLNKLFEDEDPNYNVGNEQEREAVQDKAYEKLGAFMVIVTAEQDLYKTCKDSIQRRFNESTDPDAKVYPETYTKAMNVLNNAKKDKRPKQSGPTHTEKITKQNEELRSFMQATDTFRCFICGKLECKGGNKCPKKGIDKSKWAAHIAMRKMDQMSQSFVQVQEEGQSDDQVSTITQPTTTSTSDGSPAWMGFQCFAADCKSTTPKKPQGILKATNLSTSQGMSGDMFKTHILLDNQTSDHLIVNKAFVGKVEKVPIGIDMHTNVGVKGIDRKAPLTNVGKVWFDNQMMANVLSHARLADDPNFEVDYIKKTKDGGDYFTLTHLPTNKTIKFVRIGNHYAYKPSLTAVGLVQTVEDNKKLFSKAQVDRADKARTLMKTLMMPTVKTLKRAILTNQIQNCPVTDTDCDIAIQIYGKDIASLKGKSTRSKPTPAVHDVVSIPKRLLYIHKNVHLFMDIMYVNGLPFLMTISKHLYYRTATYLTDEKANTLYKAMDGVFNKYNNAGYKIKHISADNQFQASLEAIQDELRVTVHFSAAQEHVPEAERNIRTVKDTIRSVIASIPYTYLLNVMTKMLVIEATTRLNFFVNVNGIEHYSPRQLLKEPKVDYGKHCQIPIFSFVQAPHEATVYNSQQPRTLDCLYMRPLYTMHGGHQLYHIPTGKLITRHGKLHVIPTPSHVIEKINELGKKQNGSILKIESKYFPTWSAAVEEPEAEAEEQPEEHTRTRTRSRSR